MKLAEAFKEAVEAFKNLLSAMMDAVSTALGKLRLASRLGVRDKVEIYIEADNHRDYSITEVTNRDTRMATMQKDHHRRSQGAVH